MNTYCSIWGVAVRVPINAAPVTRGEVITVTTKAGKTKQEQVRDILDVRQDGNELVYTCVVQPRPVKQADGNVWKTVVDGKAVPGNIPAFGTTGTEVK